MSERIDLSELRDLCQRYENGEIELAYMESLNINPASVLALTLAVEAAHQLIDGVAETNFGYQAWVDLEEALNRFDFGEPK